MNAEENNWGGGGLMCKCLINSEKWGARRYKEGEGRLHHPATLRVHITVFSPL